MYQNIEDFIEDWKLEEAFTLLMFSRISEDKKKIRPNDNVRSLEKLAWHLTQTLTEMPARTDLIDSDSLANTDIPKTIEDIIDIYREHANNLKEAVSTKWKNVDLKENIEVYEQEWERRKLLSALVKHQIHHRGQMSALMRVHGLQVPGTYGPAKEEWAKYGLETHE